MSKGRAFYPYRSFSVSTLAIFILLQYNINTSISYRIVRARLVAFLSAGCSKQERFVHSDTSWWCFWIILTHFNFGYVWKDFVAWEPPEECMGGCQGEAVRRQAGDEK